MRARTTQSNEALGTGIERMSARTNRALLVFQPAAASMAADESIPVTERPRRHSSRAILPEPQAASNTRGTALRAVALRATDA